MHFSYEAVDKLEGEALSSPALRARELGRALILLGLGGSSIGGFVAALARGGRAWGG